MKKLGIIMESLDVKLHPKNNSNLYLCKKASEIGFQIHHIDSGDLYLDQDKAITKTNIVEPEEDGLKVMSEQEVFLDDLDIILMRQDPPFDMNYITATYILEYTSTTVFNSPKSLRNHPEKFIPTELQKFTPETLITKDRGKIRTFWQNHDKIIIKPLYLFSGKDIHLIKSDEQLEAYLMRDLDQQVIVQKFLPEVANGDKRFMFFNGEYAGGFNRVPQEGSYLVALIHGSTPERYVANENDLQIINAVSKYLTKHDISICGIDVIGSYLTEINITCPGGFHVIDPLYDTNITGEFLQTLLDI